MEAALAEMSRRELFESLAYVQQRQAQLSTIQDLLQGELRRRMSVPSPAVERFLTVPEVAKRLRLKRARVYELVRHQALPKLAGLGKQVRVPESALNGHQKGT